MSVWNRDRIPLRRRHALGLWLPSAKLASRAYVPSGADRRALRGKRPFWFAFGGPTGDVAIPANQWVELRNVCQADFIAHTLLISATVGGSASNPGVRVQIRDLSQQPGRGKRFSIVGNNDTNFGGSAKHPFFFRKPYTFRAGHTILVKIQNLQGSTNNVQVVLAGVTE